MNFHEHTILNNSWICKKFIFKSMLEQYWKIANRLKMQNNLKYIAQQSQLTDYTNDMINDKCINLKNKFLTI